METRVSKPLAWCGLIHPQVQALFGVVIVPEPEPSCTFGSRAGSIRELREGGRHLRLIGEHASEAFVAAILAQ